MILCFTEESIGDGGTGIYKSAILIPKVAQKASAHQVCKSILVNNPCHVHALPVLRTIADDIICKHGVAVAELNEEELFYLLSRGLDQKVRSDSTSCFPSDPHVLFFVFAQDARMLLIQNFLLDAAPQAVKVCSTP